MKTRKLVRFSPQQLVDCLGSDGCDGCSPREAYQYISREGVILDADYPYTGGYLWPVSVQGPSRGHADQWVFLCLCWRGWKGAHACCCKTARWSHNLCHGQVCDFCFPKIYVYHADRLLYNEFNLIPCHPARFVNHKGDRTLESEDFAIGEGTVYGHSVLLVGYGVDEDGPYRKIKNSWGPAWGDRGFAKLRRGVKDPNGTGGMSRPGAFVFFPVMDSPPT